MRIALYAVDDISRSHLPVPQTVVDGRPALGVERLAAVAHMSRRSSDRIAS